MCFPCSGYFSSERIRAPEGVGDKHMKTAEKSADNRDKKINKLFLCCKSAVNVKESQTHKKRSRALINLWLDTVDLFIC